MKNIKHLLATAIVALVALTAPPQSRASLLFNGTNSKAVLDEPFGLTATVAGEAAAKLKSRQGVRLPNASESQILRELALLSSSAVASILAFSRN